MQNFGSFVDKQFAFQLALKLKRKLFQNVYSPKICDSRILKDLWQLFEKFCLSCGQLINFLLLRLSRAGTENASPGYLCIALTNLNKSDF